MVQVDTLAVEEEKNLPKQFYEDRSETNHVINIMYHFNIFHILQLGSLPVPKYAQIEMLPGKGFLPLEKATAEITSVPGLKLKTVRN